MADEEINANEKNTGGNVADTKYKDLLDQGVLTQEEFDDLKVKLINEL